MKAIASLFLALLLSCSSSMKNGPADKYAIDPTPDPRNPTNVFIPKNLDECMMELNRMLTQEFISEIKKTDQKQMMLGHSLALRGWIKQNWALPDTTNTLTRYFFNLGMKCPDDMSSLILDAYWRHLNGEKVVARKLAQRYREYWKTVNDLGGPMPSLMQDSAEVSAPPPSLENPYPETPASAP